MLQRDLVEYIKEGGVMCICRAKLQQCGMDVPSNTETLKKFLEQTKEGRSLIELATKEYDAKYKAGSGVCDA